MWAWIGIIAGWVWDAFQATSDYILIALTYAWHALRTFAGAIWDAAGWTYSNILKPIGTFLKDAYDRLKAVYDRFVQPVIDWLHKVSDLLRKLYVTFVQPILSAIDGVQRILGILEVFHIQWAQDLDNALQQLEDKISKPLQLAIQFINSIVSRIEKYILTADNLFQRLTHLRTIQRDLSNVLNMQSWHLMNTLTDKQRAGPMGARPLSPADDHLQFMEDIYNGNDEATGIDVEGALTLMEQLFDGTYSPVTEGAQ